MKSLFFLITLATLLSLSKQVIFKLDRNSIKRCFLIRSIDSHSTINFSYVVFAEAENTNKVGFELRERDSDKLIEQVNPDEQSYRKKFSIDNFEDKIYKACFFNPDKKYKSVKFTIENKKKENYAEKKKIAASLKLLDKLHEEAIKMEEIMYIMYVDIKNHEEVFTKSQSSMKWVVIGKYVVLMAVALLQAMGIMKMLSTTNTKITELV